MGAKGMGRVEDLSDKELDDLTFETPPKGLPVAVLLDVLALDEQQYFVPTNNYGTPPKTAPLQLD